MSSTFIDSEVILLANEQWTQLEKKWGKPVDLETDEDPPARLKAVFSTLDLVKTTFDSATLVKKVRRKLGRRYSKTGTPDYKEFLQDLKDHIPYEQCYFIDGHVFSEGSVEEICGKIDDLFNAVEIEKSSSVTNKTGRKVIPDVISCSISVDDLSFDDTKIESVIEEEDEDNGEIEEDFDKYLDEAFEKLSLLSKTLMSIEDEDTRDSVTTLVGKYSMYLAKPMRNCSPRRQRQYSTRFRELTEFWNTLNDQKKEAEL